MTTKILIAEDEPLMLERLQELLSRLWPQGEIVAIAENGPDAAASVPAQNPGASHWPTPALPRSPPEMPTLRKEHACVPLSVEAAPCDSAAPAIIVAHETTGSAALRAVNTPGPCVNCVHHHSFCDLDRRAAKFIRQMC